MKIKHYFENGYHNISQKSKYVTCPSFKHRILYTFQCSYP